MSTYVHRIVQVKVSDKWETVKIYADYNKREHYYFDDDSNTAEEKKSFHIASLPKINDNLTPLENINNYCDNLVSLRAELYDRFSSQTWDDTCPKKEEWQYNHCWATLDQLESWESELTNKFFEEMKDAYSNTKLEQILAILKNEEYNPTDSYWNQVDEIKEDYFCDIFVLSNMIHTAYIIAEQIYEIYNTNNIRILFYYD